MNTIGYINILHNFLTTNVFLHLMNVFFWKKVVNIIENMSISMEAAFAKPLFVINFYKLKNEANYKQKQY